MTSEQVILVQRSFASVRPIASTAAALFYERLFEQSPALRPLFRGDLAAQGHKLMQALGMVVASLHRPDALRPTVAALGRRHAGYGVEAAHYEAVGAALLWTLEQGLAEQFTPEVRAAWAAAYATLAETMKAAAREARAEGVRA